MWETYRNQVIYKSAMLNSCGIPLPEKHKIARLILSPHMFGIHLAKVVVGYVRSQGEYNIPPLKKTMQLILNNAIW